MNATQRAEAQISMLAADNQKLVGDRQIMQEQMHQMKQELAAEQRTAKVDGQGLVSCTVFCCGFSSNGESI